MTSDRPGGVAGSGHADTVVAMTSTTGAPAGGREQTIVPGWRWWAALAAEHQHRLYPEVVTADPHCPPEELAAFAASCYDSVRAAVARHPNTPPAVVAALAADPPALVRAAVARRPDLAPDLVVTLASDPEDTVRRGALANPNLPAADARALWSAVDEAGERLVLAANPVVAPAVRGQLRDLARRVVGSRLIDDDTADLLRAWAENPALDADDCAALHQTGQYDWVLAGNTAYPEDLACELWDRHQYAGTYILVRIIDHHAHRPGIVARVLADGSDVMLGELARRTDDVELLVELARRARDGGQELLVQGVLENPRCPTEWLVELSRSTTDRYAQVAEHPNCPAEWLVARPVQWVATRTRVNTAALPALPVEVAAVVRSLAIDSPLTLGELIATAHRIFG